MHVLEDNIKRMSIYFYVTRKGNKFIYIRNPYNQVFEIVTDDGETLTTTLNKAIYPIEDKHFTLHNYWNNHNLHISDMC